MMIRIFLHIFTSIIVLILFPCSASAYIDPGTGGMIVGGSLWPLLTAVFAGGLGLAIRFFYDPIKRFLSSFSKRSK